MRIFAALSLALLPLSTLGCAIETAPEDTPSDENAVDKQQPIIGGSEDPGNDAVVFLYDQNQGAACTGTIIAVQGSYGYILTAAHCDGMDYIFSADELSCINFGSCLGEWQVEEQVVHPNWNGNPGDGYDFSLIRFYGANASTPVIPAASQDSLGFDVQVEISGYGLVNGQTEQGADERRHVFMPVYDLDPRFVYFDQRGGQGACSGDSGGPAIHQGKVVGVTSFGDEDCTQYGGSGRVEAVYANFIAPYLGEEPPVEPPPAETCRSCYDETIRDENGPCAAVVQGCTGSCASLYNCLTACDGGSTCTNDCVDAHPKGVDGVTEVLRCEYCTACASLCSSQCSSLPEPSTSGNGGGSADDGNGGETSEGGGGTDGTDEDDGGCGCAVVGAEDRSPTWLATFGLALAAAALRRRRN